MQSTDGLTVKELEIQRSIAASDMYQLLSMFLNLPTVEMAAGILDGSLANDVLAIFEELGVVDNKIEIIKTQLDTLRKETSEPKELLTEMRREYTRLFDHPKEPAVGIYETIFLFEPNEEDKTSPSLFISPAALDAKRCYRQAGFMRSKEANEPADHMAIEMEFMAYLYLEQAKALQENNQEAITQRDKQIKEFSEAHLQKWAIDFYGRCISSSESSVYQTFGHLGITFLSNMLAN